MIRRLKKLLGMTESVEWPPKRFYEWRQDSGAATGRKLASNACTFDLFSHATRVVVSTASNPGVAVHLVVVSTGERVLSNGRDDGTRQLHDEPTLPRFR